MKYKIYYSCYSHVGKYRNLNQDNFLCDGKIMDSHDGEIEFPLNGNADADQPCVFAVFDGMGGEECGEKASLIAAQCAQKLTIGAQPIDDLLRYCWEANEEICKYADENQVGTMGTTAVILAFAEKEIGLFNIGDSKAFRFDGEKLEQITVDHYENCGSMSFGKKPPLSQNLGIPISEMVLEPYLAKGYYKEGDIYLLCSDGLTDMVGNEEIKRILKEASGIEMAAKQLMFSALEYGGRDNITIIICRVIRKKKGFWNIIRNIVSR